MIVKDKDAAYVTVIKKSKNINKSSYFLLPLLNLDYRHKFFNNSYLGIKHLDEINGLKDGIIYLVLTDEDKQLEKHQNFINYQIINNDHIYVFKLSERFHSDYLKFIDGKYSQFSVEAKDLICKHRAKQQRTYADKTDVFEIFTKSKNRVKYIENLIGEKLPEDAEVMSKININDEIYENRTI